MKWARWIAAPFAAILGLAGCEKSPPDAIENATPSPNASILPAPLSSIGPASEAPRTVRKASEGDGKNSAADAAAPQAMRGDQPPDDDSLAQREVQGVTLEAEWRYPDAIVPLKGPEANLAGIEAARRLTAGRMTIDLASVGRMRVTFDSRAMPLAEGTEIRARSDLFGHLVVWPNGSQYRVLPPGAVRTLLGERRVDAVPLVRAQRATRTDGGARVGLATKKWDLATRTGKLSMEQARIVAAGEGGPLLCRFLAEIIALDPASAPCAADDVPLRAQFVWPDGGSSIFEVTHIADRVEFASSQLLVPPSGGAFAPTNAPPTSSNVALTKDELTAFRLRPFDALGARAIGTPDEGIVLHNGTDSLRYVFIDTVPVAWVPPNRDQAVSGLQKGRYVVQWRTFLGDAIEPPITVDVPARIAVGAGQVDAGRDR